MVYVRRMNHRGPATSIVSALFVLLGCSGGSSEPPIVVGTIAPPLPTVTLVEADDEAEAQVPPQEIVLSVTEPLEVTMSVVVEADGIDTELRAVLDPTALERSDPFGSFASCSGGQRSFGPYSVLVSADTGDVAAARVLATDDVSGPGIYDADVRVELRSGASRSAVGTVTIAADLRAGEFTAFGAGGELLSGSFECRGGDDVVSPVDDHRRAWSARRRRGRRTAGAWGV